MGKNVYEKLQDVRCELQSLNLRKSGKNTFTKFTYYDLGDLLPAINLLCQKHKITPVISFDPDYATLIIFDTENTTENNPDKIIFTSPFARAEVGQTKQALILSYAKAFNCQPADLPESVIDFIIHNNEMDIQSMGAAETYQRRYLYLTAFEIVEHDSLDPSIGQENQQQKSNIQMPPQRTNATAKPAAQTGWTFAQRKAKIQELVDLGADMELFITKKCGKKTIDEVPDKLIQDGINKKKNDLKTAEN